jgi:two-component system, NarL family, invasion response regulator UvrY
VHHRGRSEGVFIEEGNGTRTEGTVRVLTVDDQASFRRVAREVIAATPGFEFGGEAGSGAEAVPAVALHHPQLALVDIRMPGIDGIETARRITSAHPEVVVVLISIDEPPYARDEAQASGAVELVRKQDFCPALLRRLWSVHGAHSGEASSR